MKTISRQLVFAFLACCVLIDSANGQALCYAGVAAKYVTSLGQLNCVQGILNTWRQKVIQANCVGCDKYFHCKGFRQVRDQCQGKEVKSIATALGDCRAADEHDPADRIANSDGLNGIHCESKYLHICNPSNNCKYDPRNGSCSKDNIPRPSTMCTANLIAG